MLKDITVVQVLPEATEVTAANHFVAPAEAQAETGQEEAEVPVTVTVVTDTAGAGVEPEIPPGIQGDSVRLTREDPEAEAEPIWLVEGAEDTEHREMAASPPVLLIMELMEAVVIRVTAAVSLVHKEAGVEAAEHTETRHW
jgi:hypothetical protein